MNNILRPALVTFTALTLLTGVAYPLLVTAIGQTAFPDQAAGSLIQRNGKVVGSSLIGQSFSDPGHFWGRPSATGPYPNNATASSGSNQGPLNPALVDAVKGRLEALRAADPGNSLPVPVELVTASASGLDPHISPRAAMFQVQRVAEARNTDAARVHAMIAANTHKPILGILGEPVVNVLGLNLALDAHSCHGEPH